MWRQLQKAKLDSWSVLKENVDVVSLYLSTSYLSFQFSVDEKDNEKYFSYFLINLKLPSATSSTILVLFQIDIVHEKKLLFIFFSQIVKA
jgi:hypothetical protein